MPAVTSPVTETITAPDWYTSTVESTSSGGTSGVGLSPGWSVGVASGLAGEDGCGNPAAIATTTTAAGGPEAGCGKEQEDGR